MCVCVCVFVHVTVSLCIYSRLYLSLSRSLSLSLSPSLSLSHIDIYMGKSEWEKTFSILFPCDKEKKAFGERKSEAKRRGKRGEEGDKRWGRVKEKMIQC